jgi:hypothetical protein
LYLLKNTDRYQSKWRKKIREEIAISSKIYIFLFKKKKKKNENEIELGWVGLSPTAWAGLMF